MSIAGKVLVVVCTLMILVWIVMISEVAALNRNWGEAVAKAEKDLAQAEEQHRAAVAELAKGKADTTLVQVEHIKVETVLRRQVSAAQKALTEQQERLSRVGAEVEDAQAAAKQAQAEQALREQEKADTEKQIAQTKEDVEKLRADSQASLAQLLKLRKDFKETLAENQKLVARLRDATGPKVKRASLSR